MNCECAGNGTDRVLDHRAHAQQRRPGFVDVQYVRERIVVLGMEILAEEKRQPAVLAKMFLVEHGDASASLKQIDLGPQGVRNLHLTAMIPERRIVALRWP